MELNFEKLLNVLENLKKVRKLNVEKLKIILRISSISILEILSIIL